MTTPFKTALSLCGLAQKEAAEFLGVSMDTIASWCAGRRTPPGNAWQALADRYHNIHKGKTLMQAIKRVGN